MKIYGGPGSGNCYKLKLLCGLLSLPYDWVDIDVLKAETKTAEFLKLNPNGQIPLLITDQGDCLAESNAILFFLASGSRFLPTDTLQLARVLQWQFFEQYSHEPYIAVARFIAKYLGLPREREAECRSKHAGGYRALDVMEQQLRQSDFLVGEVCSIADLSLYAYTHVANEGGFDLAGYGAIRRWLKRIRALEGYQGMYENQ